MTLAVENQPADAGDRDWGPIHRPGRAPGGGDGSPLQCSCLGEPTDRGAWKATVHAVHSKAWLKWLANTHDKTLWKSYFYGWAESALLRWNLLPVKMKPSRWNGSEGFRMLHALSWRSRGKGLRGWTSVLAGVLLWMKCHPTALHATEKWLMGGRVGQSSKLHRCLILRNCHSQSSLHRCPISVSCSHQHQGKTLHQEKHCDSLGAQMTVSTC